MATVINNIPYIISGFCFSLIIALGAGYIKFLSLDPGAVTVDLIQHNSKIYAELVVENNELCQVVTDYSYSRIDYIKVNGKTMFPIESRNLNFIPITIKYECNFLVFHKMGSNMFYAEIN